jgi:membrane-associated protein
MDGFIDLIQMGIMLLKQPETLVAAVGTVGLALIVFAETGLLVGFFLPGDSLLFSAGLFFASGDLNIWPLIWILTTAAIAGDATGYWIGRTLGLKLYERPNSLLFKKSHLDQTREFYDKHGGKTIVLARFVPIIRTFAPTVAGVAGMPYRSFFNYNVLGAFLWIWSLTLAGFLLGKVVPGINNYIHAIVVGIVIVSVLPIVLKWMKSRQSRTVAANSPDASKIS